MICNKCGKEITDNSVFCEYCGAKVEEVHTDSNAGEQSIKKGKKKGLKIGIIVGIVLVLALAGVGITLMIKKGGSDSEITSLPKAKTPQEEALNNYFDAINNFDVDAFMEACYPQESIDADRGYSNGTVSWYTSTQNMGLTRGPIDMSNGRCDFGFKDNKVLAESYPSPCSSFLASLAREEGDEKKAEEYEQEYEEYNELRESDAGAKNYLCDLRITYNLLQMDILNDCKVVTNNGYEVDVNDYINGMINGGNDEVAVSADDIYVARIQIEWAYGDKLYGWDEAWWNDSDFLNSVSMLNITSRNTYESIIEEYKNREYVMFIYQYNGDWYVWPERLVWALDYQVE